MNRFVEPSTAAEATQDVAAPHAGGAADLRMSLIVIYELWLTTWETALMALRTATRSRAFGANEPAAHGAFIKAEREVVTNHFALLLGSELPRGRASTNGPEAFDGG